MGFPAALQSPVLPSLGCGGPSPGGAAGLWWGSQVLELDGKIAGSPTGPEVVLFLWRGAVVGLGRGWGGGARYSSFMDAEVQQRAVEYSVLAYKGATMADIMAEMPKFPEREVPNITSCYPSQRAWKAGAHRSQTLMHFKAKETWLAHSHAEPPYSASGALWVTASVSSWSGPLDGLPLLQSSLLKRAEDTEGDAPEASAVKVRQQQMMSQALVAVPSSSSGPHANGLAGAPSPIPVPEPAAEHPGTPRAPSEQPSTVRENAFCLDPPRPSWKESARWLGCMTTA